MKKMIMFLFLMIIPFSIFAQGVIPVPTDINDVMTNIIIWTASFLGVTGLTIFLTAIVLKLFAVTGSGLRQLISWGLGLVIVVALNLFGIGFAKDLIWYGVIAYGVAVSLAANKAFDAGLIESILKMFNLQKPKK